LQQQQQAEPSSSLVFEEKLHWTKLSLSVFKGIPARVHYALPAVENAEEIATSINSLVRIIFGEINDTFNSFDPGSEVSRLNNNKIDAPHKISLEMQEALLLSRDIWNQSDGAFDITVWPFKTLWSQAAERQKAPTSEDLAKTLERVGMQKLTIDPLQHLLSRKVEGLSMDFGGIIKGYTVDRICTLFKERGVTHALVQVGGEIRVFGKNPDGKPWVLGIQHPKDMDKLFGAMSVPEEFAVSSSGNYRQPVTIGDTVYYHIFDPLTGHPIPTRILGVTVVVQGGDYPNARADAWATAVAVMGVDKGLKYANEHGIDVLFLLETERDGGRPELVVSEGFKRFLTVL
jgi:thiamine biosynthesis lipoprotein